MTIENSNPQAARRTGPLLRRLPEPHAAVSFTVETSHLEGCVTIEYLGPPAELINAGAATAELLARGRPGLRRVDRDGDRAFIYPRKGWVRLRIRGKLIDRALHLPGITYALIAEEHEMSRAAATRSWRRGDWTMPERPHLRLVVDNTR